MRFRAHTGLTLVEIILTIGLTAALGVPMGMLLNAHLGNALRARDATVAMNLARLELERLDSLNDFCDAGLAINAPAGTTVDPYQSLPYAMTRIVACQAGDCTANCGLTPANALNGVKRIEIQVRKSGSATVLASLVTYRTKFVLFGS